MLESKSSFRLILYWTRVRFTDRLQNVIKWFCRSIDTGRLATSPTRSTSTACQNHWQPKPRNRTSTYKSAKTVRTTGTTALGRKIDGKFSGGLAEDVFIAASLAEHDDAVHAEKITTGAITSEKAITIETIVESARAAFLELRKISASDPACITEEVLASLIYAKFAKDKVSKAIAAQYLAQRLLCKYKKKEITADSLRNMLPAYITEAIDYVAGGNSIPLRRQGEPDGK